MTIFNRHRMQAALTRCCGLLLLGTALVATVAAQRIGPSITSTSPLPSATAGTPYNFQFQASGGSPPYTWAASALFSVPAPFSLTSTGILQGLPDSPGQFNVGVRVTDAQGRSDSASFMLTVADALVIVTQSPLPSGMPGQPYQTTLLATGGQPPYFWDTLGGSLPPGYQFNPQNATISGTTQQPGVFTFQILVVDSQQRRYEKGFTLAVQAGQLSILPDPPLPLAFVGQTYSVQLMPSSGSAFSWSIAAGALPPGLQLAPQTGSITGIPTEPGTFVWTALMQNTDGGSAVRQYSIRVEGDPKAPPVLDVSSIPLSFSFANGGRPATRGLRIRNTGGGSVPVSLQATTQIGAWLNLVPASGAASAAEPLDVLVQADPAQLSPGALFGNVRVTAGSPVNGISVSPGETVSLPVSMSISGRRQFLRLSLDGLTFTAVQGGGTPPALSFDVINDGAEALTFSTTVASFPSASWLQAPSAQVALGPQSRRPVVVQVNPGSLAPGVYFGLIEVRAPNAAGELRLLTVVLNVLPAGSRPPSVVEPIGLLFVGQTGGPSPQRKTFRISNVSGTAVSFTSQRYTEQAPDPFTHSPEQGQVLPNQPMLVSAEPNTAGLEPGVYQSVVALTFSDGTKRAVMLTLIVGPAGGITLNNSPQATCPSQLNITIASYSGGYPSYVDAPAFLRADVADDCGQPFAEGTGRSVRAERAGQTVFLEYKESGAWEATLDFQATGAQPIELSAQDLVRGISGNATIESEVQPQLAVRPEILSGGVVHGASFAKPPLAPGTIISIFGEDLSTNLDPGVGNVTTLPLPELFAGTRIRGGSAFLPLFFSWTNQVNVGLPLALNPDSGPLSVVAFRGSVPSDTAEVSLATAHPGLFTLNASGSGEGIFQDIGFRLVSGTLAPALNPNGRRGVKPGEPVIIYATGLGAVTPPVSSGVAASADPLSHVSGTVQLTIGGQPALTDFKGLAPGFVSLYQINALVPAGLAPGNANVVLTVNGVSSPAGLTLSIE